MPVPGSGGVSVTVTYRIDGYAAGVGEGVAGYAVAAPVEVTRRGPRGDEILWKAEQ
jgi:hypothetical protein